MYRNDHMEGGGCPGNLKILSDCEANHAIRIMEEVAHPARINNCCTIWKFYDVVLSHTLLHCF